MAGTSGVEHVARSVPDEPLRTLFSTPNTAAVYVHASRKYGMFPIDTRRTIRTLRTVEIHATDLYREIAREPGMDNDAFDHLARRVNLASSRRSALSVLGGLGLVGAAGIAVPGADAKRKKKKKKNKKKRGCTPQPRSVTCRNRCGSVLDNCRQTVQCGDNCPVCTTCSSRGTCELQAEGAPCGGTNSCTADGQCTCDSSLCGNFEVCSGDTCVSCAVIGKPCCTNNVCQVGAVCNFGTCLPCGRSNELCCANQICDPGRTCVGGICKDCGATGLPCCTTGIDCVGSTCNAGTCV